MAKLDVAEAVEFFTMLRDKDALIAEREARLSELAGEVTRLEARVRELDELYATRAELRAAIAEAHKENVDLHDVNEGVRRGMAGYTAAAHEARRELMGALRGLEPTPPPMPDSEKVIR